MRRTRRGLLALPLSLVSELGGLWGRHHRAPEDRFRRRPGVEPLEDRTLLSATTPDIPAWVEQGPGPIVNGSAQVGTTNPAVGAAQAVLADPHDANIVYIGTVNGGIWKSTHATTANPDWQPLTDNYPVVSIGALAYSPIDPTPDGNPDDDTIYAGTGRFTNRISAPGMQGMGVLKSTDGGATWSLLGQDTFSRLNINSIVPTSVMVPGDGQVVLAATLDGSFNGTLNGKVPPHLVGLYRSEDGGKTWSRISGTFGLPDAGVSEVVGDPGDIHRFYAAVPGVGIFRSTTDGITWQQVNNGLPGNLITNSSRIRLAVSPALTNPIVADSTPVFAAIIDKNDQLAGVFRSTTGNAIDPAAVSWDEVGTAPPNVTPGKQGDTDFSFLADRTHPNLVYVGGDRLAVSPFAGNLFVGDADGLSAPDPWTSLVLTGANGTEPHADSRNMVFDGNGDILEVDDGGIYRLQNVQTPAARVWTSVNYSLRDTEIEALAYDPLNDTIFAGAQDNGVSQQVLPDNPVWSTTSIGNNNGVPDPTQQRFLRGDGGVQAVDTTSMPNTTIRYSIGNTLNSFYRIAVDNTDTPKRITQPQLANKPGGIYLSGLNAADSKPGVASTQLALNALNPRRLLIGQTGLYESFDQGDVITNVTPAGMGTVTALAYGGFDLIVPNEDVAYVGTANKLYLRTGPGATFQEVASWKMAGGGPVQDIVLDPFDWHTVYVTDLGHVWQGTNLGIAGQVPTWRDLTGNLSNLFQVNQLGPNRGVLIMTLEMVRQAGHAVLLAGGLGGVYRLIDPGSAGSLWSGFGAGLPNVVVDDLHYDATDKVLVAGTRGRGAWKMSNASDRLLDVGELKIAFDSNNDVIRLVRDANNPLLLDVFTNGGTTPQQFRIATLQTIAVTGLGGTDSLVVDESNGVIDVPGHITYHAGGGLDQLTFEGVAGETFTNVTTTTTSGKVIVTGPLGSLAGGVVDYDGLGVPVVNHLPAPSASDDNILHVIGASLDGLDPLFQGLGSSPTLVSQNLPVLGQSLGDVLNGNDALSAPALDDEGGDAAASTESASLSPATGTSLFRRLVETGEGAFALADIGSTITTLDDLRARLDALDDTPGNVTVTQLNGVTTFDVRATKTLEGSAALDLSALGGDINVSGAADVSADVTLHLVFGVDAQGFFIDTNSNPDPELTISNVQIVDAVQGDGRFGFTDVALSDGTLTFDPLVKLTVSLHEPGPDPITGQQTGRLRLDELGASIDQLATATLGHDPAGHDVTFTGTFTPAPVEDGQPAPFTLGTAHAQMVWPDVTNLGLQPDVTAADTANPADRALVSFLNVTADQVTGGLADLSNALHTLTQQAGNVLSTPLAVTGTSLGQILDSPAADVAIDNSNVAEVTAVSQDANFNKFAVVLKDGNLPLSGVAAGDTVNYIDALDLPVSGVVDSVDDTLFVVRFDLAASQTPKATAPSFTIARSGSIQHELEALLNPLIGDTSGDTPTPTLQELIRRLAHLTGVTTDAITVSGDVTGASPVIQLGFTLAPAPLVFDQKLDLGADVQGLSLNAGGGFAFTVRPTFQLSLGLNLSPNTSADDHFFLAAGNVPVISFGVSADLKVPGYQGTVGYLNVGLNAASPNSGAQVQGTFTAGLNDPGTAAQDGRVIIDELELPNPSATKPAFQITPAGSAVISIADAEVVKIADAGSSGTTHKFQVTLKDGGLLTGVAAGDSVSYLDTTGHSHTGTIDNVPDGTDFVVSYSANPLFSAAIDARVNVDPLVVSASTSNATSNLGSLTVSLDGQGAGHVTTLDGLANLKSQIQVSGNLPGFTDYDHITPSTVLNGLGLLVARLGDLSGGFKQKLPVLNLSIDGLVNFAQDVQAKIGSPNAAQLATVDQLEAYLLPRLGPLAVTLNAGNFEIGFSDSTVISKTVSLNIDLGTALGSLGQKSGGQLNITGSANLNATVGFSTADGLALPDRVYLAAGGSNGFSVNLSANAGYSGVGAPISLTAGVGPLSVTVPAARVLLNNAGFSATVQDGGDGDGKLTLAEITKNVSSGQLGNIVTGGFSGGSLQAVVPIDGADDGHPVATDPTQLEADDAWVDVAGLVTNLANVSVNTSNLVLTHHTPNVDTPYSDADLAAGPFAGQVVVSAYNVGNLLTGLTSFDPNKLDPTDGLNKFLDDLQQMLNGPILGPKLPLLGDKIKSAVHVVDDLRAAVQTIQAGDSTAIDQALTNALGLSPADITNAGSDLDHVQFNLHLHKTKQAASVALDGDIGVPALGLTVYPGSSLTVNVGYDFQFDFGVSQTDGFYVDTQDSHLTLSFDAGLSPTFHASGRLAFLQVDVTDAPGKPGDPNDPANTDPSNPLHPTSLGNGQFTVSLLNPFGSSSRLTLPDIASGLSDPGSLVKAQLTLNSDVHLHLEASFGGDAVFPSLGADFHLDWNFLNADTQSGQLDFGGTPSIGFDDVQLHMGSFITKFVGPIIKEVNNILDPIRPIIQTLSKRLPGLSDLPSGVINALGLDNYDHNGEVSILDLAEKALGGTQWGIALQVFHYLDQVSQDFASAPAGDFAIPLGNFEISTPSNPIDIRGLPNLQDIAEDPTGTFLKGAQAVVDYLKTKGGNNPVANFATGFLSDSITNVAQDLGGAPLIQFPILEDPTTAFGLLLGKPVNLVFFNPPPLDIPFQVDDFFHLLGPLGVRLIGGVKAKITFHFGFDTFGVQEFFDKGATDPSMIADGFYVSNTANADGTGPVVPQVLLNAQVAVGGGVDAVVASFTVNGGIYTHGPDPSNPFNLTATLCEPDDSPDGVNGKLRFRDITNALPGNLFDTFGDLRAGIYAELSVGVWPLKHSVIFPFAEKVLLDLNHDCDQDKRPPVLANDPVQDADGHWVPQDNKNGAPGELQLNMGPRAGDRKNFNTIDGNELFTVTHVDGTASDETVDVTAFGFTQRYYHVNKISAHGGNGNDTITIQPTEKDASGKVIQAGALAPSALFGDAGNDNLTAGDGPAEIHGGAGDDTLTGGAGNDTIYGEGGNDLIAGGPGDDRLVGGSPVSGTDDGNDTILGDDGNDILVGDNATVDASGNVTVFADGKGGNDQLHGGAGNDTMFGGPGDDQMFGDAGDDNMHGQDGNDSLSGGDGNDLLDGGTGNDVLNGDAGNDTLQGGPGDDALFGGDGNDWMIGDSPVPKAGDLGGNDYMDGGAGDDVMIGDNGTIDAQGKVSLISGTGNDTMIGGAGNDRMYGQGGDDSMQGGDGNDTIFGGAGNDNISGGAGNDYVEGGVGNDTIYGGPGNDTLLGGSSVSGSADGRDAIYGDAGDDVILGDNGSVDSGAGTIKTFADGQGGSDTIYGGSGNDTIFGGTGGDVITGGLPSDTGTKVIVGDQGSASATQIVSQTSADSGDDTIFGGGGDATILGGDGKDSITGGLGRDVILGDNGQVLLSGGVVTRIQTADPQSGGDDTILGGLIADTVFGGTGNDQISGSPNGANDVLFGDNGAVVGNDGSADAFNLFSTDPGCGGVDTITGGSGNAIIVGGSQGDLLTGGSGNDVIVGDNAYLTRDPSGKVLRIATSYEDTGGNDTITTGLGADTVLGGTGDDSITGGSDTSGDILLGDNGVVAGNDGSADAFAIFSTAPAYAGSDTITGGPGNDIIVGGGGNDTLRGNAGNDVIAGDNAYVTRDSSGMVQRIATSYAAYGGDDSIDGGAGADTVLGGTGNDSITGGPDAANDILLGDNGVVGAGGTADGHNVYSTDPGFAGSDTILGGPGNEIIVGGGQGDSLAGSSGNDAIVGDNGFITRDASDTVLRIATTFEDSGGNDTITTGAGADTALGGTGDDVITGGSDAAGDILMGDNGVVAGNDGTADANDIFSTAPAYGGRDSITAGPGNDTIIGGSGGTDLADPITCAGGGDTLLGNGGDDVIVGDDAHITRDANNVVQRIATTYTGQGGNDSILGGDGNDTILGGFGMDTIAGNAGSDVILGDNGEIDYAVSGTTATLTRIATTDPALGCGDTITGDDGNDTILGGTANDRISGGAGNDVILGDNGEIDFTHTSDTVAGRPDVSTVTLTPSATTPAWIRTTDPTIGGDDTIAGNGGSDTIIGGTGNDRITGDTSDAPANDDGNDLIFGDNGVVYPSLLANNNFFSTFTGPSDGGGNDTVFGNAGDDTIIGGQGRDVLFGGTGNDDLIGGHNVQGGSDTGDVIDGGAGNDAIAGDNALIVRNAGSQVSPRFRVLGGTVIYGADGSAQVTAASQADPNHGVGRTILLFDHAGDAAGNPTTPSGLYGNDTIAGGANNDVIFGELGDDVIQGDGSIDVSAAAPPTARSFVIPGATVDGTPLVFHVQGQATDGDDYVEGNGGNDLIYGDLGQDDLIGDSSDLFGLNSPTLRPVGSDTIFGGAGDAVGRNDPGDTSATGHARDADTILGDNGDIFRLVGVNGAVGGSGDVATFGGFLAFNYDTYTNALPAAQQLKVIPRAVTLLDYTAGGAATDLGRADLLHGEAGDDFIHGEAGNDVMFGEGQDDQMIGGSGNDRIYGGNGEDSILGDDGRFLISRNGLTEPLYGVTAVNPLADITLPGPFTGAWVYITGRINSEAHLLAPTQGGNDVIYGGLGDDWIHGGAGDDAVSGGEAQVAWYDELPVGAAFYSAGGYTVNANGVAVDPNNPLGYDPTTRKLAAYDANNPFQKIAHFFLNFDATDGSGTRIDDGKDRIFGDDGNDWLVGGTDDDRLFGGKGDDLINADGNLETNGGLNNQPDPDPTDRDFVYGGDGLDVMIANTGGDRLFDWTGEFNTFLVPFSPFGEPTVYRTAPNPHTQSFLLALGAESGADATLTEPDGELGLFTQKDPEWATNHGAPRDPQAGNTPGTQRDTQGSPEDDRGTALPLAAAPAVAPSGGSPIAAAAADVTVNKICVAADPSDIGQLALFVGGSSGNDTILVRPGTTSAFLDVVVNGLDQGQFLITSGAGTIGRILVYGNDGDDTITVSPSVTVDAVLYGGAGNDTLTGGGGNNFLDGGDGNDVLNGGTGRNVLVGGLGQDTLNGGKDDDVLIGGTYKYSGDLTAVFNLMAVWTNASLSYAQRLSGLRAGGPDGLFAFTAATILDDGVVDYLFGNQGTDWFWLYGSDQSDKKGNETLN